jgi:5-formyltetrahydrofolate cyclo-ligase
MAVPSPSPKAALRADALKRRRDYASSLTPELRRSLEGDLAEQVVPHLVAARAIAAYHPFMDEISPAPILAALADGQRIGLPWFADRDARMIWRDGRATEPGPWGVLQPPASAEPIVPDLVIVPLVAADRRGKRIGRGKGHYDRALAHLRAAGPVFALGIAWEPQISEEPFPADAWDMPLDAIATPKEWIECR